MSAANSDVIVALPFLEGNERDLMLRNKCINGRIEVACHASEQGRRRHHVAAVSARE